MAYHTAVATAAPATRAAAAGITTCRHDRAGSGARVPAGAVSPTVRRGWILQHDARFANVAQPPSDIPIEAARHEPANRSWSGPVQRRPVDVVPQHGRDRVGDGVARKRAAARQHLVEHGAERPDVAPPVRISATCLLRTHVGGGAKDDANLRQSRARNRR